MKRLQIGLTAILALAMLLTLWVVGEGVRAQTYPPPVGSLSVQASATTPAVGSSTTLTATVLDPAGQPVAGAEVTFKIVSQPGADAQFANGATEITATTDANGTATAVLSVGSSTGNIIIEIVSGEKTSQLTLQVQPSGEAFPPTGSTPPSSEGGGALPFWLALVLGGMAALFVGGAVVLIRRRV